jgi:hypothetical protein
MPVYWRGKIFLVCYYCARYISDSFLLSISFLNLLCFLCLFNSVNFTYVVQQRIYLAFIPGSWRVTSSIFGTSQMMGVSLSFMVGPRARLSFFNRVTHGGFQDVGCHLGKTNDKIDYKAGALIHLIGPISGEKRGTGHRVQLHGQWFEQSCLCKGTLIKTLDMESQVSFLVGNHTSMCQEGDAFQKTQ